MTRKSQPGPADALRGYVVDAVAEKLGDKIEQKKARARVQPSAKNALQVEALERVADHVRALDVWTRSVARTRRPRFTREEIAAVAMQIADAEGFDAVSMRRIATELDAGTMTLYHYVRTKDELLTLLSDAVMGEIVIPDDEAFPEHWREALTLLAQRTRAALTRHPWILDITDDPPIGPNTVRHFDQTLQAVASLDLPLDAKFDIVLAVDEYVFGYCFHERNHEHPYALPDDGEMIAYVDDLITTGCYPQIAALAQEYGLESVWAMIAEHLSDPGRFDRNLVRLLDGIEAGFSTAR